MKYCGLNMPCEIMAGVEGGGGGGGNGVVESCEYKGSCGSL